MMEKFYDLLERSVILQAVLTTLVWITICAMLVMGKPLPDLLANAGMIILGFYFGAKHSYLMNQVVGHGK